MGHSMPTPSLLKNSSCTIYWRDKSLYTFLKGHSPKVNNVAGLDFELASFETTV